MHARFGDKIKNISAQVRNNPRHQRKTVKIMRLDNGCDMHHGAGLTRAVAVFPQLCKTRGRLAKSTGLAADIVMDFCGAFQGHANKIKTPSTRASRREPDKCFRHGGIEQGGVCDDMGQGLTRGELKQFRKILTDKGFTAGKSQ
ncbi:MAG: hypothetical protein BWY09_01236 [Candidatus Hydrogenedentes bacterium ADurb.Bin179]|nr:MAG: hypothetical protein BWY09_01236 [Candidatus Hydrogenedentes bacterium ADurb.Bin179]